MSYHCSSGAEFGHYDTPDLSHLKKLQYAVTLGHSGVLFPSSGIAHVYCYIQLIILLV